MVKKAFLTNSARSEMFIASQFPKASELRRSDMSDFLEKSALHIRKKHVTPTEFLEFRSAPFYKHLTPNGV